jgi:hypothetical protein
MTVRLAASFTIINQSRGDEGEFSRDDTAPLGWAPAYGYIDLDRGTLMSADQVERKLAANLAADVVGNSCLMGIDEEGTLGG